MDRRQRSRSRSRDRRSGRVDRSNDYRYDSGDRYGDRNSHRRDDPHYRRREDERDDSKYDKGKSSKDKDQLRKERLEVVKRITQEHDSDQEDRSSSSSLSKKVTAAVNANGIITFQKSDRSMKSDSNKGERHTVGSDQRAGDDNYSNQGQEDDDEEEEEEEFDVMAVMGFGGFNTTKDKPHEENHHSAAVGMVAKHKGRKYRQYMNRRGGFNRPLQKMD